MDVHTTNYTVCCYDIKNDKIFSELTMEADHMNVVKYLERIEQNIGGDCHFQCGYEAGSLGYSLYHQLADHGIECVILAPSTMATTTRKKGIKTDKRDASKIAKCLAYNMYSPVYVLDGEDNAIKEYIRMRNDTKEALKKIKQQTLALCMRHGKRFTEGRNYWTMRHLSWLKNVTFNEAILHETLREYLTLYHQLADKIAMFDARISELSHTERYEEKVKKLTCFIGIKEHTALAMIVETGDFKRFPTAQHYASYIGLVPGEESSGDTVRRTGITKAGNSHIRKILVESAQSYSRGAIGAKSAALKARQKGNAPEVIAYADKANERLRRKCYKIAFRSKRNIAVTAVARELACFAWGMMTNNTA